MDDYDDDDATIAIYDNDDDYNMIIEYIINVIYMKAWAARAVAFSCKILYII